MQTIITVKCLDQTLQLINDPRIASGGVKEVRAEFEFCPLWDGLAKTAMFYRDPKEVYPMLLVDDACDVPKEVLAEPGLLHISVSGSAPDAGVVRTSAVLYKLIEQGAPTEGTVEPGPQTPGIYDQIAAEIQRLRNVGEEVKQQQADFEEEIKDNLIMVISDTEPETCPIWWLDTSYRPENAAEPVLVEIEVDGKLYAAEVAGE